MSRSGYSDDCGGTDLVLWRGAVNSAIKGRRGQTFLRDLAIAMDAMPVKELIADDLQDADGDVCAIGVIGRSRGIDMGKLDPEDRHQVAAAFNIAPAMAAEIVFENDEGSYRNETPSTRWTRMRKWVDDQIVKGESS